MLRRCEVNALISLYVLEVKIHLDEKRKYYETGMRGYVRRNGGGLLNEKVFILIFEFAFYVKIRVFACSFHCGK